MTSQSFWNFLDWTGIQVAHPTETHLVSVGPGLSRTREKWLSHTRGLGLGCTRESNSAIHAKPTQPYTRNRLSHTRAQTYVLAIALMIACFQCVTIWLHAGSVLGTCSPCASRCYATCNSTGILLAIGNVLSSLFHSRSYFSIRIDSAALSKQGRRREEKMTFEV